MLAGPLLASSLVLLVAALIACALQRHPRAPSSDGWLAGFGFLAAASHGASACLALSTNHVWLSLAGQVISCAAWIALLEASLRVVVGLMAPRRLPLRWCPAVVAVVAIVAIGFVRGGFLGSLLSGVVALLPALCAAAAFSVAALRATGRSRVGMFFMAAGLSGLALAALCYGGAGLSTAARGLADGAPSIVWSLVETVSAVLVSAGIWLVWAAARWPELRGWRTWLVPGLLLLVVAAGWRLSPSLEAASASSRAGAAQSADQGIAAGVGTKDTLHLELPKSVPQRRGGNSLFYLAVLVTPVIWLIALAIGNHYFGNKPKNRRKVARSAG